MPGFPQVILLSFVQYHCFVVEKVQIPVSVQLVHAGASLFFLLRDKEFGGNLLKGLNWLSLAYRYSELN